MTLEEIKTAVLSGQNVCVGNPGYQVKHANGQWLIVFAPNGYTIGLTWTDGVTLNGKEEEFFIDSHSKQ